MPRYFELSAAVFGGFVLGAVSLGTLSAQNKAPAYYIAELEVRDQANYVKEFAIPSDKIVSAHGGHFVGRGSAVMLSGEPLKGRVVVATFESVERIKQWYNSDEFRALWPLRDKYASVIRAFAIEGIP